MVSRNGTLKFGHLRAQPSVECGGLTPPSDNRTEAFPETVVKGEGKINGVGALHDSASRVAQGGPCPLAKMSDWPHSPVYRLAEAGAYMVTCGTYLKPPSHIQAEGSLTDGS
jgi:hypothetical protein